MMPDRMNIENETFMRTSERNLRWRATTFDPCRNGHLHPSRAIMLYFAYGSNMLTQRLKARVPSASPKTVAVLFDHGLRFHKRSQDGSGKCDIVKCPGEVVHGVV